MPNKQLTASVRLNISQAEKALTKVTGKIKSLDAATAKININQFEEQLKKSRTAAKQLTQALADGDKAAQRLAANAEKRNRMAYEQWWKEQLIAQEQAEQQQALLAQEKIRQQSLNTLTKTDKAAERLKRQEYEQWWAAALTRQEWEKAHPVLTRLSNAWQKIDQNIQKAISGSPRLTMAYDTVKTKVTNIVTKVRDWWTKQKQVTSATKSTGGALGSIWTKLKGIAATYLGIMSIGQMFGVADTIISAENKLNYVGAQQLGDKAYNADGSYSPAVFQYTQDSMNKMYNSAQKVRMGYSDMMSNVSKSMVLAGDAFNYSTDNAIRFQEVMAEAYAIGGASNSEMHSSMYQLIQALGSGTFAGDELRSVREGAPLAYAAIEKFVQGVYNTDESLKDLASQGKVTADMVVAAILNAGDEMDTAFAQTAQTFSQTWQQIKNAAMKSFIPIANRLRDILNKAVDSGLIAKIEKAFDKIADIIISTLDWIAENWHWLEDVITAGVTSLTAIIVANAAVIAAKWIAARWPILLIGAAIGALIYVFSLWKDGALTTTDAISNALYGVAVMGIIAAIAVGGWVSVIIAVVIALIAFCLKHIEKTMETLYLIRLLFVNIGKAIANTFLAFGAIIYSVFGNIAAFVVNLVMGCVKWLVALWNRARNIVVGFWNALKALTTNVGIAFENACAIATNAFWDFVSGASKALVALMAPLNAVLGVLGLDTITVETIETAAANNKKSTKSYVDISDAFMEGANTYPNQALGDAWSEGWHTMEWINLGEEVSNAWNYYEYENKYDAINEGYSKGSDIREKLDNYTFDSLFGSMTNKITETVNDAVSSALEDNPLNLLNPDSPQDILNSGSGGGVAGSSGKTADNTGSMADSMELAEEDLSFLRDLAEKEWKKEFTTAAIKVDMSNVNTINNQGDLDGWVTILADKLREELYAVADGVYV